MWHVWQAVNARDTLMGSFPESLNEVVREGYLHEESVRDPWGRPYRYLLREDSVLLGGATLRARPIPTSSSHSTFAPRMTMPPEVRPSNSSILDKKSLRF